VSDLTVADIVPRLGGASSAHLTVSETFPVEICAETIAVFFALALVLGAVGPILSGALLARQQAAGVHRRQLDHVQATSAEPGLLALERNNRQAANRPDRPARDHPVGREADGLMDENHLLAPSPATS
jgi:hypothetical protein